MIKNSVISLLLCCSVGYGYSMELIYAHVNKHYRYMAIGCLTLVVTGLALKKIANYCVQKESLIPEESQVSQKIEVKYADIKARLHDLKIDIDCAARPLEVLEKDRRALLQEIIPDVLLESKTEKEIHERIMYRLCPVNKLRPAYTSLAHAVGDVNQALLDLKKKQKGQHDLDVKGYVL